jgi:hypothetical protein
MLVHNLDDLSAPPVNPQKKGLSIHYTGDNLAQSLGWPNGNDPPTEQSQVCLSRSNRVDATECNQPTSYALHSHCFSTLTG